MKHVIYGRRLLLPNMRRTGAGVLKLVGGAHGCGLWCGLRA